MGCAGCGGPLAPNRAPGRERKWCSERCRKNQYQVPCLDCGAPCNPIANGNGQHCKACAARHTADTSRANARPRRELIERLWREGTPTAHIAAIMGWSHRKPADAISRLRAKGYDLPVRNRGASEANKGNANNRYSKAKAA